ncbi:hypothetical protein [Methylococcus sp. EFPC2]|uniref:hypothetical protein n=1 Tax=Methylococcus sp. EFPC2 TaxID=2812648 RepID=UPI001967EC21|nr:hypothetical protein [Methylococcus sp. EFPC2]QSA98097.1 hypothetical protein JWZ97_04570 [Methylococcus sp. EFPC2]
MKNITKALLTVSLTLGLLASCAQPNPHPMDMTAAIQNARTPTDHQALAEHYEQAAKDAEAKVEEHKKLLDQYKARSYLYGKQAMSFQSHCEALIRSYQQVAKSNAEMARMHRQMAMESH